MIHSMAVMLAAKHGRALFLLSSTFVLGRSRDKRRTLLDSSKMTAPVLYFLTPMWDFLGQARQWKKYPILQSYNSDDGRKSSSMLLVQQIMEVIVS